MKRFDRPTARLLSAGILLLAACAAAALSGACSRGGEKGTPFTAAEKALFDQAAGNGVRSEQALTAIHRVLRRWLGRADPRTLLFCDRWGRTSRNRRYEIQNTASDLTPHLVITSYVTEPGVYRDFMMQALRNEVRYTTALDTIPGDLDLRTGELGPADLFGGGEYCKDGILAITELLGRTPWFPRMVDLAADIMNHAPVPTDFGNLPDSNIELNGDMLQVLVRLAYMTGDRRFIDWARRISDAYVNEVFPRNHGMPSQTWDFQKHAGDGVVKLRDHGNELIVGLSLHYAYEQYHQTPRAPKYRAALRKLFDRILQSAHTNGMLYFKIDAKTLEPISAKLNDNWGYVYGSMYAFYQATGEEKYRDAVLRVLNNLPTYESARWESNRMDGYADTVESALYLLAHEPVPAAFDWLEKTVRKLAAFQGADGRVVEGYLDGNFNRTMLLYALYKSMGCRAAEWTPGLGLGGVRDGERLYLSIDDGQPSRWRGDVCFDDERWRRNMNLDKDYVRLNEYPEWYTVNDNWLYRVRSDREPERILLGAELIRGVPFSEGNWIVEPVGPPPYGPANVPAKPAAG